MLEWTVIADLVHARLEFPEAATTVNGDVDQRALEFRLVDLAKFIHAALSEFQLRGEYRLFEVGRNVFEECGLRFWSYRVDVAERETDYAVGGSIRAEGTGNLVWHTKGLMIDSCAANVDSVDADFPTSKGLVAVFDVKNRAFQLFEGFGD